MENINYITEVIIYADGIYNMAKAKTLNGKEITGNWNIREFRQNILNNCDGWTRFIDKRYKAE